MENIINLLRSAPKTIKFITIYNIICVILMLIIGFFAANLNQLLLIILGSAVLLLINYFFLQLKKWSFYLLAVFYGLQMTYLTMPAFGFSFGFGFFIGMDIGINLVAIIMFFTTVSTAKYLQIKSSNSTLFAIVFIIVVGLSLFVFSTQTFIRKIVAGKYVDTNNSNEYIELDHYGNITVHESAPFALGKEVSERRNGILHGKYRVSPDGYMFSEIETENGIGVYILIPSLRLQNNKITESKTSRVWLKQN